MERAIHPRTASTAALLVALAMSSAGCNAVKNIFKAGLWLGVVAVIAVLCVALVIARVARR